MSAEDNYVVVLTKSGEAALAVKSEIVFAAGEGEMDTVAVGCGTACVLPGCDFTAPFGKRFSGKWMVEQLNSLDDTDNEAREIGVGEGITVSKRYVRLTAQWEDLPVATISGVSGSFNDRIKLNYYFDFPENVLADEKAYVTLTNEDTGKMISLLIKDAESVNGKGRKFSIPLAAKEASDTITAKVYDGQGNALAIRGNLRDNDYTETGVQYTLMQYFTWLESDGTESEKAVGAAAKDYCAAAQIYFNYHADDLTLSSAVDEVTADMLSGYIAGRKGKLPTGVSLRGITAILESDNTLRVYLGFTDVDAPGFSYTIDEEFVEPKRRSDGAYYLALDEGVFANELDDAHTYSVSDGTRTYTITASVMSYARSFALKSNEAESNLGKALYLYNQAANAAFGQ